MSRTTWPDHGPVTPNCPVECLLSVMSQRSWNRLARSREEPATVREVVAVAAAGKLRPVEGLGREHAGEITTALVYLGFAVTGTLTRPPGPGRSRP
jgi:hypothetical protein